MPKVVGGYSFPDDATQEEIASFLGKRSTEKQSKGSDVGSVAPPQEEMSWGEYAKGLGRKAASGLTFNFSDEGIAAIRSRIEGIPFEQALAEERQKIKDFEGRYPVAATVSEIGGALPTMLIPGLGAARAAQGATRVGRALATPVGQAAVAGSKQGALSGLGGAEGGLDAEGVGQRLMGAGTGALVGGAAGAGTGAVLGAGSRALGAVKERFFDESGEVAGKVAMQKVLQDLERSGMSPADAKQAYERMYKAGVPAQLFDVSPSLTSRAEGIVQRPGRGAELLAEDVAERQMGQRDRVMAAARGSLNQGRAVDYYATEEALTDALRRNARPYYEQAYRAVLPEQAQFELQTIADSVKRAFPSAESYARRLYAGARNEFGRLGTRDVDTGSGIAMKEFDALPQVQKWDYLMRGLNQAARRAGYDTELGRVGLRLRGQIADVLDNNVDAFRQARSVFRGDKEVQEALEAGRSFLRADPEALARSFPDMSSAEQAAYRIGALKNIRDRIYGSGDTTDATKKIGENIADRRAALEIIMPNPVNARLFQETLEYEARLLQNANRMVQGPATARRSQQFRDLESDDFGILGVAADVAAGAPTTMFRRMLNVFANNPAIPEKRAEAIANILRAGNPRDVSRAISSLEKFSEEQAKREAASISRRKEISGQAGRLIGGQAGEEEGRTIPAPPLTIYGPGRTM